MNQRQWIPISESPSDNLGKIKRINIAMIFLVTAILAAVGFFLSQLLALTLIGLVLSVGFVVFLMRTVESSLLDQLNGVPVDDHDHARLINVVDGLCVVSGDRRPSLYVVNNSFPVALAISGPQQHSSVVVSRALMDEMDRVEIEAVMAHVLWRIRSGNTALTCYLLRLYSLFKKVGLAPLATLIIAKSWEDKTVLWADISACQATRYPPAVISALQKCNRTHRSEIDPIFGPLLFVDPKTVGDDTTKTSQVPILGFSVMSLEQRIAVVKEM